MSGDTLGDFVRNKRLLRAHPDSQPAMHGLLAGLMERRRYLAAERLARTIETRTGLTPWALGALAEVALVRGDDDEVFSLIEVAGKHGDAFVNAVRRLGPIAQSLRAEKASGSSMQGVRHIAVAGVAFTGSTAFGIILGSTPGFAHAGETHWLTVAQDSTGQYASIARSEVDPVAWPVACRVCGRRCEVFNPDFRRHLAADETAWYGKIARRLAADTLVTTDKNLHTLWEKDPLFRFDLVVLYKSPRDYMRSVLKQAARRSGPGETAVVDSPALLLDRWTRNYLGHLKTLRPSGRRVVLNWECFVAEPEFHLHRLATLLDAPVSPALLSAIRLGHFIGGNIGINIKALKADPTFYLRPSKAPELTAELEAVVHSHKQSQFVERLLEGEYRRQFFRGAVV